MSISPSSGVVDLGNGPRSIVCRVVEGSGVTPGLKGYVVIPFYGAIRSWSIVGGPAGSAVVDVWRRAGAIPTVADSIVGASPPTITAAQLASDDVGLDWSVEVDVGDVIAVNLDSVSGFTDLTVQLNVAT